MSEVLRRHWKGDDDWVHRCDGRSCWYEPAIDQPGEWFMHADQNPPMWRSYPTAYPTREAVMEAGDKLDPLKKCRCTPTQVLAWEILEATKP